MKIDYRFVPYGTTAPYPVTKNELWLDVGDRSAPQVLDHHGGDTTAKSAFELIVNRYKEFIVSPLSGAKDITFVLHTSPDLDAICSAWLAIKILTLPDTIDTKDSLKTIERVVSENDQGLVNTNDPKSNWAIVMRMLLLIECSKSDDFSKLQAGLEFVEKTYVLLEKGGSLEYAAEKMISPKIENALEQAKTLYENDISKSDIFQVVLPKTEPVFNEELFSRKQTNMIKKKKNADAVILHNPESILFKELARWDLTNSPQKQGFDLLIVSKDVNILKDRTLKRYIISTDPLSGFYLKGLGAKLEKLEQIKEESMGLPLLKGREILGKGLGRYGNNIKAAWYDGSGHNYTIVDSPAIENNGKFYCVSCLTIEEIKAALAGFI